MSIVIINAITVPSGSGDELAKRFAARAGAVDDQEGFEGFELLQPTDGRDQWLVVTRWRDEESFQAWMASPAFGHGHRSAEERSGGDAPPPVSVGSETMASDIQIDRVYTPRTVLKMKLEEYLDMQTGKLNGQEAFMTGKIKVEGDMGFLMQIATLNM